MKRRIIRSASLQGSAYPEAYIKLQKALQDVRHLIEECVDEGLEDYAAWNEISHGLFLGIQAVSRACRDADTAVESSTAINAATGGRRFIQFDESFAEVSDDAWYAAVRIAFQDYSALPEEVKDTLGDLGLVRGEDDEGYIYIDVEDRIAGANTYGLDLLASADICKNSKTYEVIQYTEVWS